MVVSFFVTIYLLSVCSVRSVVVIKANEYFFYPRSIALHQVFPLLFIKRWI
jgi:hypothetical protein